MWSFAGVDVGPVWSNRRQNQRLSAVNREEASQVTDPTFMVVLLNLTLALIRRLIPLFVQ